MSNIEEGHYKQGMSLLSYQLEYGCHLAHLCHSHCCCHCAYAPTSDTASHDNPEKINSWVSFAFLYGYGVPSVCPFGLSDLVYYYQ